jgi:hypothetical protein
MLAPSAPALATIWEISSTSRLRFAGSASTACRTFVFSEWKRGSTLMPRACAQCAIAAL